MNHVSLSFLLFVQIMLCQWHLISKPARRTPISTSYSAAKSASLTVNTTQSLQYARTRSRPEPFLLMPSACIALRNSYGNQQWRRYSTKPPGGSGGGASGGFPGLSFGPQHQKGEALKEYVRTLLS